MFCYQILCFSMFHYLNAYTFFFNSYSSLMKCFFPLRNSVVYLNFTGYQMKAQHVDLIDILINEN